MYLYEIGTTPFVEYKEIIMMVGLARIFPYVQEIFVTTD
jgi:hypothetical protein